MSELPLLYLRDCGARLLTTDKDFDQLDPVFLTHDWIDPVG